MLAAHQAGQKVLETVYGSTFTFRDVAYACSHSDIVTNAPLITGGFSPSKDVTVTVRADLFPDGQALPKRGDRCSLTTDDESDAIQLQVQTVISYPGNPLIRLLCADVNQGA